MRKIYPVSLIVFFVLVALGIVFSGPGFVVYLNIPSLVVVIGFPASLLLATHSLREIGAAFRASRSGTGRGELQAAVVFFSAMQRYVLWSGVLATMIGVIAILSTLGAGEHVGMGGAIALITVFYSIMLNLAVALPFRHAAEKRLAELD